MESSARVCLLIPTHALPPLSYRIPQRLARRVRPGSAVVAPLSGRQRLGFVVATSVEEDLATEELVAVVEEISLPEDILRLCRRACELSAISLAAAIQTALPPGVVSGRYRIKTRVAGLPWGPGEAVERRALTQALGKENFRAAEIENAVELSPELPAPPTEEWAVAAPVSAPPDFGRARRQRELWERLVRAGGGMPVGALLAESGTSRSVLRSLVGRGVVRLEQRRALVKSIRVSTGRPGLRDSEFANEMRTALDAGGAWVFRTPFREMAAAAGTFVREALERRQKVLVLAPETSVVDEVSDLLCRELPPGVRVASYHSGVGRERTEVWRAARVGEVDVLVGTRAAALIPLKDAGAFCVVDEPNTSHRAASGHEGLPLHVRDLVLERLRGGETALFFSPNPSLRLYAQKGPGGLGELPARRSAGWPKVRLVDMRGSGATLSSTFLQTAGETLGSGGRVGVLGNRLGYATSVVCGGCGLVRLCPGCEIPLTLYCAKREGPALVCARCGYAEDSNRRCGECGSLRALPTGAAVERLRERLSEAFGETVGTLSARVSEQEDARIVVGTARPMLARRWDALLFPDADAFLLGSRMGAVEQGFRVLHRAAESARTTLLVQTRNPEHYALRAALREDYPSFASAEMGRLKRLGYPPFSHLATLTFRGGQKAVRRAVKSVAGEDPEVSVSEPALVPTEDGSAEWRVLLRASRRESVARAATRAALRAAKSGGKGPEGVRLNVEVDPEEV